MSRRKPKRNKLPNEINRWTWDAMTTAMAESEDSRHDEWYGERTAEELAKAMRTGDAKLAQKAETMFDKALEAVLPSTEGGKARPESSIVGSSPIVGAYLAGSPLSMRRRKRSPVLGPVRIFVDLTTSCGVDWRSQLARGTATAALAYAVQTLRPVELWTIVAGRPTGEDVNIVHLHQIGLAPLDMNRVALALSDIGLPRRLYKYRKDGDGTKRVGYGKSLQHWVNEPVRDMLALGKNDVYVQPLHVSQERECIADPMKWLLADMANQEGNANILWEKDKTDEQ